MTPTPAVAQIACINGVNPNACVVAPGVTLNDVSTFGNGFTISNAGAITSTVQTFSSDSNVTNSGSVGTFIQTTAANSGVTSSGSVGTFIQTTAANSGVTSSGSVGTFIQTTAANSSVTNSGSVSTFIQTNGANSGVTNSGSVGAGIGTFGINSKIANSGSVGTSLETIGANSAVTNSGFVGTFLRTQNANSSVNNSGSVGTVLRTDGANSGVTNSGSVGSGAAGHGIVIAGLNPNLTLLPGSVIQGLIDLSGAGTRTLNVGNGLSIANTFVTGPTVINTNSAPFAVNGNQVAVLDPTALSQHDEMLADLTSGIFNSIHARLNGAAGTTSNGFAGMPLGMGSMMQLGAGAKMKLGNGDVSPGSTDNRSGLWAQAFGGIRSEDDRGSTIGSDHKLAGGIAGIDGTVAPGVRLGAFGGGSNATLETSFSTQELDADSYFGGFYASTQQSKWFAHAMLTAGRSNYDSTRVVANNLAAGGLQTATASYDGTFISPELTVGVTLPVAHGVMIEPSLRARYAHLSIDGYSESGAADGLTVADRDISLWQGRAQLAFPFITGTVRFAPRIGVEAWTSDNDNVSAILIGQAISFNPGGDDDEFTGFVGATATTDLGSGGSAFLDGEVHMGDDGFARAEARSGLKFQF